MQHLVVLPDSQRRDALREPAPIQALDLHRPQRLQLESPEGRDQVKTDDLLVALVRRRPEVGRPLGEPLPEPLGDRQPARGFATRTAHGARPLAGKGRRVECGHG